MTQRPVLAVAVAVLVSSACGGASTKVLPSSSASTASGVNAAPAKVFEVSKVVAAMSTVETARWAGVSGLAQNSSGVVDSANDYFTVRSTSGTGVAFAMARQGARLYIKGPTGQWCLAVQASNAKAANQGFPTLVDAVEMLRKDGASVRYIGPEVIRGVATSHFRSHAAQTFDVWVDAHDQLRRISGRIPAIPGAPSGVPASFAEDFFDFGVPVHFNPPKADTPRCEHDSIVP